MKKEFEWQSTDDSLLLPVVASIPFEKKTNSLKAKFPLQTQKFSSKKKMHYLYHQKKNCFQLPNKLYPPKPIVKTLYRNKQQKDWKQESIWPKTFASRNLLCFCCCHSLTLPLLLNSWLPTKVDTLRDSRQSKRQWRTTVSRIQHWLHNPMKVNTWVEHQRLTREQCLQIPRKWPEPLNQETNAYNTCFPLKTTMPLELS